MKNLSSQERTQAKSAVRALDILDMLTRESRGLSFTELLQFLRAPKSSLHELLAVLVERGFVEYDATGRLYTLGIRVWESGQAYMRHHDLVSEARPLMHDIVDAINETVQLATVDGVENVYLAKVDCSHPLRLQSEVGRRLPAHATGLGKALLAYLPPQERERRLQGRALARYTSHTLTDLAGLEADLAATRARGFALDDQEYTPGLRCVAVPIRDQHGRAGTAMSVSIPIMRATIAQCASALSCLATASLEISRRQGCADNDPLLSHLTSRAAAEQALTQFDWLWSEVGGQSTATQ